MSNGTASYKIIIMGDGAVGKTSLRKRYFGENFQKNYAVTLGADFAVKRKTISDIEVVLHFWDIAGQPRFKEIRAGYFKNSSGAILVFDLTRRETFTNLPNWIEEFRSNVENPIDELPLVLIGNKLDLINSNDRKISLETARKYTNELSSQFEHEIDYYETSALTGVNVEMAFDNLVNKLISNS